MFDNNFEIEKQQLYSATIDIETNSIFFNKAKIEMSVSEVHENCVLTKIKSDQFQMYILVYKSEKNSYRLYYIM